MLTSEVKRRIDTARDILVGKVPTPTAQVEQITIALIYKFMDDMDAQAEELGGKRSFFAGEYAKYGWSKLLHSGLGGHEMLNLYAEAIAKMPENPGIPKLFREIFKNAFLPYRDPETLREFLKIIDGFTYDHSEDLGDAYEYLLSVLGSQGDAGQFRTPRHIIDFMVAIIDPKKDESILDPACGTSGFLISAYKHIMAANTDASGVCSLTPEEKKRLAANITGYDISPDMVRLSQVNLYLHGFVDPHIFEYDTLTSQEKWDDYANIVLANPPFMSPKGGIKPHNRFSIQSKRSEVLFVDYIAEHLTPTGRSAVIVPEGIIFQSQNAYKQLRKLLVEEYLVAVVSLPAGLFQPYSGVKTSILVMDKALARQRDTVAFFTVNNDGFSLGAQRRAVEQNDLPTVQTELTQYLNDLRLGKDLAEGKYTSGHVVGKEKLAEGGEYNLSGERYRESNLSQHTQWPLVSLGEICGFMTGGTPTSTISEYYENGTIPWLVSGDIHKREIFSCEKRITQKGLDNSNARILPQHSVLIALNGQGKTRGTVALLRIAGATCNQSLVAMYSLGPERILHEFLFYVLHSMYSEIRSITGDSQRSGLNIPILKDIKIPLPPLEIQKEISAEIEGYQKIIDGARTVVENYKPQIQISPEWNIATLIDICETVTDGDHQPPPKSTTGVPFIVISNISKYSELDFGKTYFVSEDYYRSLPEYKKPRCGDILYTVTGSYGIPVFLHSDVPFCFQRHIALIRPKRTVLSKYLFTILRSQFVQAQANSTATGVAQKTVSLSSLRSFKIPLPPLEIQQQIVAEIEAEQALVNANKELIARFEKKIEAVLARVWGEAEATDEAEDLGDLELPDEDLQFPLPGREAWAQDCILSAIEQSPQRHFDDNYNAAVLGTVPSLCVDLLPSVRAKEFKTLVQKTHAFSGCKPEQRIRKELMQDALQELGVNITAEGCSLAASVQLEHKDILTPIIPYLFEALDILRDVIGKASTSQRIKHLTPKQQQTIREIWSQEIKLAA